MYMSDYTVQLLHKDRLRDAEKVREHRDLIRDINEQAPVVEEAGLIYQVKQWLRSRKPLQPTTDPRRATAV